MSSIQPRHLIALHTGSYFILLLVVVARALLCRLVLWCALCPEHQGALLGLVDGSLPCAWVHGTPVGCHGGAQSVEAHAALSMEHCATALYFL